MGCLAECGLGIDQRDAEALRRKLRKRESERSPGEATAGDYDVVGRDRLSYAVLEPSPQQCHVPPGMRNC